MKKVIYGFLLVYGFASTLFAAPVRLIENNKNQVFLDKQAPTALDQTFKLAILGYGYYQDFKFNSNANPLFNIYKGHVDGGNLGAENIKLLKDLTLGVSAVGSQTSLEAASFLNAALTTSAQFIDSKGFYAHLTKRWNNFLMMDFFGGYNHNTTELSSLIFTANTPLGFAKYYGNNEYIGLRTFLGYVYKNFIVQADVNYWYTHFSQNQYNIIYTNFIAPVEALTTKVSTFTENMRLYYKVSEHILPFINAGLIQVPSTRYSRPVGSLANFLLTTGSLPSLTLDKSGYFLGAGLFLTYKNWNITPSYQYGRRGSPFQTNTYMLSIQYVFD